MMNRDCVRWALVLAPLLAACGGGGGGANSAPSEFADLAQDTVPSGPRVELGGRDFFAMSNSGAWLYEKQSADVLSTQVTREVSMPSATPDSEFELRESDFPSIQTYRYRETSAGLVSIAPFDAAEAPGLVAALPTLVEYPTPFYPVGGQRTVVRQGDLGRDLDGDGRNERFRFEFTQVFRGFQTMQVLGRPTEVAAFLSTVAFGVYATSSEQSTTSISTEEAFLADGVGIVRLDRRAMGPNGEQIIAPYTLLLIGANVAGLSLEPGSASTELEALPRRDMVYDAARTVYYATVDNADASVRNRIAVIDAGTGNVAHSRGVGSKPGPLALSADRSVLYVGLQGSGDIVKLALPSLAEAGRMRLPVELFNRTQFLPEDIAVAPGNANEISVSLYRAGATPRRHAGLLVVRDLALFGRRTPAWAGGNLLTYSASGARIYSLAAEGVGAADIYYFERTSGGLARRDGLGITHGEPDVVGGSLTVGSVVLPAEPPMTILGGFDGGWKCSRLLTVAKVACLDFYVSSQVAVFDANSLQRLGSFPHGTDGLAAQWRIVPGPAGQVAIQSDAAVTLVAHPLLQ